MAPIIAERVNSSVISGIFPDVLKVARVVPLFTSGKKYNISIYRPISTLVF